MNAEQTLTIINHQEEEKRSRGRRRIFIEATELIRNSRRYKPCRWQVEKGLQYYCSYNIGKRTPCICPRSIRKEIFLSVLEG